MLEYLAMKQEQQDQGLAQDFDDNLTEIMGSLNDRIANLENNSIEYPHEMRQTLIMESKHNLLNLCFMKVKEFFKMQA